MNVYTPERYAEGVFHLAVGVEPRSEISGQRLAAGVDVRWERYQRPVDRWRRWLPGETLSDALPRLERHRTGRFARRYDEGVDPAMDIRVFDRRRAIVPRRLGLAIATEAVVLAAEADPDTPPHPKWQRAFVVALFPGAAADLPSGATVLRGTIVHDRGDGRLVPVRWPRVRAATPTGVEVGWAHGDDRGEFVLVARPAPTDVNVASDPTLVRLTVGAVLPPAIPNPADPKLAEIDPLWDLPVEPVVASATPATEPTLTGRRFLAEHTVVSPLTPVTPIPLPHGRQTSVVVRIA